MRRIVLPQAMRVIIPPTGNETISMLKTTSLAYVATVKELFGIQPGDLQPRTSSIIALLIVASIWYLFMTSVLTIGQYYLERRFARGAMRQLPLTPLQRFRACSSRACRAPARPTGPRRSTHASRGSSR